MFFLNVNPRGRIEDSPRKLSIPRCAEEERQKTKTQQDSEREKPEAPPAPHAKMTEKGKKLKEDMDQLLDKIDSILEENAEEFVKNYVQRGGE